MVLFLRFTTKNSASISVLPHTCHVPRTSHFPCFGHFDDIWWSVDFIKFLSALRLPVRPKYPTALLLQCLSTARPVRVGADKSLARPTSRCRRTESIMSFERGVCSCAEFQVVSCYRGWREACQATRASSTTSRREMSSSFFFVVRGRSRRCKQLLDDLKERRGCFRLKEETPDRSPWRTRFGSCCGPAEWMMLQLLSRWVTAV